MLVDAEDILYQAGEVDAIRIINDAIEATTGVITATYDGPKAAFPCKR